MTWRGRSDAKEHHAPTAIYLCASTTSSASSPSPAAFAEVHPDQLSWDSMAFSEFREPALSQLAPQRCPDFFSLANVFSKNKLGSLGQAKAPYSLIEPYLALGIVEDRKSFLGRKACFFVGPFTANTNGAQLSCTLLSDTNAWIRLAAVTENCNLSNQSIAYKTFPGVLCLPAADADASAPSPFDHKQFQNLGSFVGFSGNNSQLDVVYAQVGHDSGNVMSRFSSVSLNPERGVLKAFFGGKAIQRAGSHCDRLNLDFDSLQHLTRNAPLVALCGCQLVVDKSGADAVDASQCDAVLRSSLQRIDSSAKFRQRCSLKVGFRSFSFSLAHAQKLLLSFTIGGRNFQHSCHLGIGFKVKNFQISPKFFYF